MCIISVIDVAFSCTHVYKYILLLSPRRLFSPHPLGSRRRRRRPRGDTCTPHRRALLFVMAIINNDNEYKKKKKPSSPQWNWRRSRRVRCNNSPRGRAARIPAIKHDSSRHRCVSHVVAATPEHGVPFTREGRAPGRSRIRVFYSETVFRPKSALHIDACSVVVRANRGPRPSRVANHEFRTCPKWF